MKPLWLSLAALTLTAACSSIASVRSVEPCAKPVYVPERWLNDREVTLLWLQDRKELLDCGAKVDSLSGRELQ